MEKGLTKNQIIVELAKSSHGDLKSYVPITKQAAKEDPEFLAHLIAWNQLNGQIRDSKIALPVASFTVPNFDKEFGENSFAHLGLLDPRSLLAAWNFAKDTKIKGNNKKLRKLIEMYLRIRESNPNWLEATVLQHRSSLRALYSLLHIKPSTLADNLVNKGKYKKGSAMDLRRNFHSMKNADIAATISKKKLPYLALTGALGNKIKDPDILLAVIQQMSPTELITNTKALQSYGVKDNPALRAAFEEGLTKVADSKKSTFKTTTAIENIQDEKLKDKLRGVQDKQLKRIGGVDGNWLILGDKSGSMHTAIETSRLIAATLAKMVTGQVHLVFFDSHPAKYLEVAGKSYDEILAETKNISANGGTSIGCGLQYILDKNIEVDGIAIVSDGAEHSAPYFSETYHKYCKKFDKDVPLYFYHLAGEAGNLAHSLQGAKFDFQEFDLQRTKVDYHSLPNLIKTMNVNRYSLIDAVMETKLLSIKDVFKTHADLWL